MFGGLTGHGLFGALAPFVFQQILQVSKRLIRCPHWRRLCRSGPDGRIVVQEPGVLVFMTVDAKKFPVAAVRWIIIVVVVRVMHSELMNRLMRKFPSASRADPWKELQSTLPITALALLSGADRFGDDLVCVGRAVSLIV